MLVILLATLLPAAGRSQDAAPTTLDSAVATAWSDLLLELVRSSPGFTPPVAARTMGYLGVTLWEAVAPGTPGGVSLATQLNAMPALPRPATDAVYDWRLVANSAAAGVLRRLFADAGATPRMSIDGLEASLRQRYAAGLPQDVVRRSLAHGRLVAAAIFAWARTDGGHEGYRFNFPVQYEPPAGPGLWTPTPPGYQRAMQPFWGENRPFLLTDGGECLPAPPLAYDTRPDSAMYADALAVYTAVRELTPEQREIALFWADDPTLTATPPGHSWAIATQVLRDERATLALAAETYARLGIAVADAFVACWHAKYVYNRLRPITYIQQVIDPTWNAPRVTDPVLTPPFPEYPSGHATEAGAAAVVLGALFGEDYAFADRTQARLGFAPRAFPSFRAAAEEAAASRLFGGIHFPTGNTAGLLQGECVGRRAAALTFYR
jgi:membrane-associated phospholipid phosphatase